MNGIYEELYQGLLGEGITESVATAVVNRMYENEELHNVEVLDESIFRAATAIGKMMFKGPGKKLAAQIGTGHKATRAMGYATMRQGQAFAQGLGLTGQSGAMTRRGLRAGWTPSRALPSRTPAGIRKDTLDALTKGTTSKSGALVGPGKGGPLVSSGKTAGLGASPKVEPIKIRDLGSTPSSGGPTRYQGTRSGGQLPPGGGTTSRMGRGQKKAEIAAAGATNVGPATPSKGSPTPPALPGAGQSSSRRNAAAATAATAALGTTGTGVRTGTTSAIVKRQPSLADKVRNAVNKNKRGIAIGAVTLGAVTGSAALLGGGGKNGTAPTGKQTTLADVTPTTPGSSTPSSPTTPRSSTPTEPAKQTAPSKKRMTKIDRDVEELMQMRAASMDRQGRKQDAAKLRSEIEKKYAGYERN